MSETKKILWLLIFPLIVGCGTVRPVFGPPRVAMTVMGETIIADDQQNPYLGEVVFRGVQGLKTEARVFLDGQYIATIRSEVGWQLVGVRDFGPHVISGEVFYIYIKENRSIRVRIGCFRQGFEVSPLYRNAAYYWWRVEIWFSPSQC